MRVVLLITIIALLFCLSCLKNPKPDLTFNTDLLKGNWIVENLTKSDLSKSELVFAFEDSLCQYILPWKLFTPFKINKDTLIIKKSADVWYNYELERLDTLENTDFYKYKIIKLDSNSLKLLPYNTQALTVIKEYVKNITDTLSLLKIKIKNQIVPTRISFSSSTCFGRCPSQLIEIDNFKTIKFYGLRYTEHQGGHIGKLDDETYQKLITHVQNIDLEHLQIDYAAEWPDDQERCLVIEYKEKSIKSCVYGFDTEPIELRLLLIRLLEMERALTLQAVPIKLSEFKHYDTFLKNGMFE